MHFQIFWKFFHVLLNNWHVFYSRSILIFGKVWGLLHLFLVEKNPLWRQWKDANLTTNSIAKLILLCQCSTKIPSSSYREKKKNKVQQIRHPATGFSTCLILTCEYYWFETGSFYGKSCYTLWSYSLSILILEITSIPCYEVYRKRLLK